MPEEIVRSNWTASTNIYRALLIKAIFLCVFAMIALFTYGWHITLAVVYGGGTALLGSLLVAYHMWRAERFIGNDAAKSFRSVMRCERMLIEPYIFHGDEGLLYEVRYLV